MEERKINIITIPIITPTIPKHNPIKAFIFTSFSNGYFLNLCNELDPYKIDITPSTIPYIGISDKIPNIRLSFAYFLVFLVTVSSSIKLSFLCTFVKLSSVPLL